MSVTILVTMLSKRICDFVLSLIDYCRSLRHGCPKHLICNLQNCCLICRSVRTDHISPILRALHWLPVESRIQYKVIIITFKALNDPSPLILISLISSSCIFHLANSVRLPILDSFVFQLVRSSGQRTCLYQAPLL